MLHRRFARFCTLPITPNCRSPLWTRAVISAADATRSDHDHRRRAESFAAGSRGRRRAQRRPSVESGRHSGLVDFECSRWWSLKDSLVV